MSPHASRPTPSRRRDSPRCRRGLADPRRVSFAVASALVRVWSDISRPDLRPARATAPRAQAAADHLAQAAADPFSGVLMVRGPAAPPPCPPPAALYRRSCSTPPSACAASPARRRDDRIFRSGCRWNVRGRPRDFAGEVGAITTPVAETRPEPVYRHGSMAEPLQQQPERLRSQPALPPGARKHHGHGAGLQAFHLARIRCSVRTTAPTPPCRGRSRSTSRPASRRCVWR